VETIIANCTVTLENDNCYIERNGFSASLACLEDTGCLHNGDASVRLSRITIRQIAAYAESHAT
jgi:hypothetical protein